MSQNDKCIFTNEYATWVAPQGSLGMTILRGCDSRVCGKYNITESAIRELQYVGSAPNQVRINCAKITMDYHESNPDMRFAPIWCVRSEKDLLQRLRGAHQIFLIEDVQNDLVDHSEKPIALLSRVARNLGRSRAFAPFYFNYKDQVLSQIVDIGELGSIVSYLIDQKYIEEYQGSEEPPPSDGPLDTVFSNKYNFTVDGWHQIRQRSNVLSKKVFIATAFSWIKDDDLRPRAIQAIVDACKDLGYEADTVTQNHSDYITNKIISDIRQARFVVAELTYHNRGVYFEAGLARGLGKNVFHVVREGFTSSDPKDDLNGTRIHFDIQQIMYRKWDNPENLRELLRDWIEATEGRA
ncbi:hypothetical protein [Bdellovibrio bacteriovorus]|uniref:hypothetical protein n=1 Tax=Bdellovibrio bacteriovorus TaxID=959 RepID=UPI0035A60CAD